MENTHTVVSVLILTWYKQCIVRLLYPIECKQYRELLRFIQTQYGEFALLHEYKQMPASKCILSDHNLKNMSESLNSRQKSQNDFMFTCIHGPWYLESYLEWKEYNKVWPHTSGNARTTQYLLIFDMRVFQDAFETSSCNRQEAGQDLGPGDHTGTTEPGRLIRAPVAN